MLACLTAVIWGFAFVAIKFGLDSFSAPQLTALRFLFACLPAIAVPRPKLPWSSIVLIGLTLFAGQHLLLFFAYTRGLPPGIASVTQQTQAFFTVLLAAVFLHDLPTARQWTGMAIAFIGLTLIGLTVGADLTFAGLGLGLGGALSWAIGNVLVKRTSGLPVLPLVVWASLVPPLPALVVSALSDHGVTLLGAVAHAPWLSLGAAVYLGAVATLVAYTIWGDLLQRYPTAVVAPFALLAPCVGIVASAVVLGEIFGPTRFAGMALILAGLAIAVR
jgi:O-acetylserine/cysteine efflux transporter